MDFHKHSFEKLALKLNVTSKSQNETFLNLNYTNLFLEPLEGIYGRFPSVDPVAVRARVPYLGKIYIEKKPLEPKLH